MSDFCNMTPVPYLVTFETIDPHDKGISSSNEHLLDLCKASRLGRTFPGSIRLSPKNDVGTFVSRLHRGRLVVWNKRVHVDRRKND